MKFWFDLPRQGHKLYAKIKSNNYCKLQYDAGITEWKDQKWNWYGSVNHNKALQNFSFKLGCCHVSDKCSSDNRVRVENKSGGFNYWWYHRTVINHNKFSYGLLGVFDLTNRVIQKNNLLVKYKHDDKTEVFLKAECDNYRSKNADPANWRAYFDTVTFDLVRKVNDTTRVGLDVRYFLI